MALFEKMHNKSKKRKLEFFWSQSLCKFEFFKLKKMKLSSNSKRFIKLKQIVFMFMKDAMAN